MDWGENYLKNQCKELDMKKDLKINDQPTNVRSNPGRFIELKNGVTDVS